MNRRYLTYMCLLFVLCSVAGCAKTYHMTFRKPDGTVAYTCDYDAYALGNIEYEGAGEWYESGALKAMRVRFKRDISSPIGEVAHGISETAGAAANKF